jgi:TonB family protein
MKKNILLVEYAMATVDKIKEWLSPLIFEITVIEEGDVAKALLEKNPYDMLITAAMLPKFHGFNLSYHAATNFPGIKIIIISEIYKGMDYKHQAITQYRADDFFEKPLQEESFKKRVLELLGLDEKSLSDTGAVTSSEAPVPDTKKIPTVKKLEEEEKKLAGEKELGEEDKLSSEDLFGDIIEDVQESQPYEIKLDEELEEKTDPHVIIPKLEPKAKKPEPKAKKAGPKIKEPGPEVKKVEPEVKEKAGEEIAVTRQLPGVTEVLKKDAVATQMLPDLEELKKAAPRPKPAAATQKIDIDLDHLIKGKEKKKDTRDVRKQKKIEDDISKKFEDTLSGLGIKGKKAHLKEAADVSTRPMKVDEAVMKKAREMVEAKHVEEVGGYEIIDLIARGGMAEIYKAKKKGVKGFEKLIALKKILSGYGKDDKYIEMFVDEAKIAAELTHPNIVHIYDLGKKDDYYFIAMEYVSGKDLRLILRKLSETGERLPEALSLFLVLDVLKALNYAHAAKNSAGKNLDIVHRDVSPPNILVSYTGDVKLTDFGVSKASIKMHHTVAGALKGKLLYMSPEQARADKDIDHRADLYSAGIILFELITGEKLFMEPSEMAVLQKVQAGDIIKPSQVKHDIDPQLEIILLKMLNKDKNKRYQRASDIISDIQAYLVKNYDHLPTAVHLSYAIHDLFKEDIKKEGAEVDLKPLPYKVNRIKKIEEEAPVLELEEEQEVLELQPEEAVKLEETAAEEEFQPLVEITFDEDQTIQLEPAEAVEPEEPLELAEAVEPLIPPEPEEEVAYDEAEEPPAIQPGFEVSEVPAITPVEEEEFRKKKKYLFIALIVIIVLGAIIAVYLITSQETPVQQGEPLTTTESEKPAAAEDKTRTLKPTVETEVTYRDQPIPVTTEPAEKPGTQEKPAEIKEPPRTETQQAQPPKEAVVKAEPEQEQTQAQPVDQELQQKKELEQAKIKEEELKRPEALKTQVKEGDVVTITDVDTPPVTVSNPPVEITEYYTRRLKATEVILVSYLVDHNGKVEDIRLIRKSGIKKINTMIEKTIRTWTFKPAVKNNVKVKVWKTVSFTLKK